MLRALFATLAIGFGFGFDPSLAADPVTLQLKWIPQAQFAGYLIAKDKGFYEEENLDVAIKSGGPDIDPAQVLAGGGADIVVDWMPSALASRENGSPVVNIAQPFKTSGMMLACRKETGIARPEDFRGKTIGVWFAGNEYPFLSWMAHLAIPTTGGADGVTIVPQGLDVDLLIQKQADCISAMSYNEYWQLIDAGIPAEELVVFKYQDYDVATLEDGLYALEENLSDPAFIDKMARFLRASVKGWDAARENPDEAIAILLQDDQFGAQAKEHQARMLAEVNKLTEGSNGSLSESDYDRTVKILLSGGSEPVITREPEGAYTHAVTEKAGIPTQR